METETLLEIEKQTALYDDLLFEPEGEVGRYFIIAKSRGHAIDYLLKRLKTVVEAGREVTEAFRVTPALTPHGSDDADLLNRQRLAIHTLADAMDVLEPKP